MNILHIDSSSSDATDSHSRRLSLHLVAKLKAANPGAFVLYRDLAADRLPHVDTTIREAWTPDGKVAHSLLELATRSRILVGELKRADIVVVGSPMYNFTVPSTLKSWIDHIAIAEQTFRYSPNGPVGLLTSKAYLALSSGGVYSEGPFAKVDHLSTYLTDIFKFLGVREIKTVRAEGIAYGPKQDEAAMVTALNQIDAMIADEDVY